MSSDVLCKDCPQEFAVYFDYVFGLQFTQKPDYKFLKILIEAMANREKIKLDDNCFDWNIKLAEAGRSVIPKATLPVEVDLSKERVHSIDAEDSRKHGMIEFYLPALPPL